MEVELADTTLLPPRRAEVVMYAARGMSAKEIGRRLGISPATVEWHLDEAKNQFHALTRLDLVSQGWMQGLFKARMLAWMLMAFSMIPAMRSRPSPVNGTRPPAVRNVVGRSAVREFRA
tara:strand:- start:9692 stop:10048 length:357 start_codon:yes stop_codon:yes gene_type:complete